MQCPRGKQGFRACGREEGALRLPPPPLRPPAAHKQIHTENSSHKTHLIQPIRRVRCVSFAKKSTPKKGVLTESWGKSSLGARLRTRKVTGRDASLPAPLLAASLGLVGRGTVGALPQTPQGTLSLDPARGRRKGTKSPLDPFSRLSWSRFHAPSACSFLALRLSPCFLPQLSVKNQKNSIH